MENNGAKISISISEGKFEISGPEEFVSKQIEIFKDTIDQVLKNTKHTPFAEPPRDSKHIEIVNQAPVSVDNQELALDDKYSDVFVVDEDSIRIITDIPGSSNSAKTLHAAILYAYAKKLTGDSEANVDEIRKICENHGFLDNKNFSTYIKDGDNKYYLDKGKAGARVVKLIRPGEKKAEELINQLLENAK